MKIEKVSGCCSMLTISQNPQFKGLSKNTFTNLLISAINEYNEINSRQIYNNNNKIYKSNIKTVIIITNKSWSRRPWWLKKAYSYEGNSHVDAHVCYVNYKNGI